MIQVICESCGNVHDLGDNLAWKTGKCKCWAFIKIPEWIIQQEEKSWYFCPFCKKHMESKPVKSYEWLNKFTCDNCSKESYEWYSIFVKWFLVFVIMLSIYYWFFLGNDNMPVWAIITAASLLWRDYAVSKVIDKNNS